MTPEQLRQRFYPKNVDCIGMHKGYRVYSIEKHSFEDETEFFRVARCSHCHIPVHTEQLTKEEEENYLKGVPYHLPFLKDTDRIFKD